MLKTKQVNYGIVLVEVLITTVITAIGTLAVIMLLTNLNSSSDLSKARDEALSIAHSQMEILQNNLDKAQYHKITSAKETSIKGVNANYLVSWRVTNQNHSDRKRIKTTVKWIGKQGKPQQIELNHLINWSDALKSASIASYGVKTGFTYLSPNQTTQAGDQKEIKLPAGVKTTSLPYQMKKYFNEKGDTIIVDSNNRLLLTLYKQTDNQEQDRKIVQISGNIYYQGNIQASLQVLASQSAYCFFPSDAEKITASSWQFTKYVCVAGNGWSGKIGLVQNHSRENTKICPDNAREYLHYSLKNKKYLYQNGINSNYSNQDFVITNKLESLSCSEHILVVQNLLAVNSINEVINAENHTLLETDNVHSLSGEIKLPENKAVSKVSLSIEEYPQDCRILNQLDHFNDAYSCIVEVDDPSIAFWTGNLIGSAWLSNSLKPFCDFSIAFEKNSKSASLDLDLSVLCKNL
jgi:hypothetical protein